MSTLVRHNIFTSQHVLNIYIYYRFCRLCIINVWKRNKIILMKVPFISVLILPSDSYIYTYIYIYIALLTWHSSINITSFHTVCLETALADSHLLARPETSLYFTCYPDFPVYTATAHITVWYPYENWQKRQTVPPASEIVTSYADEIGREFGVEINTWNRAAGSCDKAPGLYSSVASVKFRPGYRLSWDISWYCSVSPGKFRDSTLIRRRQTFLHVLSSSSFRTV
jgi:hypothetical protein